MERLPEHDRSLKPGVLGNFAFPIKDGASLLAALQQKAKAAEAPRQQAAGLHSSGGPPVLPAQPVDPGNTLILSMPETACNVYMILRRVELTTCMHEVTNICSYVPTLPHIVTCSTVPCCCVLRLPLHTH